MHALCSLLGTLCLLGGGEGSQNLFSPPSMGSNNHSTEVFLASSKKITFMAWRVQACADNQNKKLLTNTVPSSWLFPPFLQTWASNSLWVLYTTKHALQHKKGKFSGNDCISSFIHVESSEMVHNPLLISSAVMSLPALWVCKQTIMQCNRVTYKENTWIGIGSENVFISFHTLQIHSVFLHWS